MREHKYRAWDKSTNQMFDVGEIHFCRGGTLVMGSGAYIGNGWSSRNDDLRCDVILMQYTGLKDKHGKDIYERDIVRHGYSVGVIVFLEGAFCFKNNLGTSLLFDNSPMYEIIGNIYQTPELLK